MEQENSCLVTCLGTLNKKNQKTTYFRTETEILQYKHHEKMQFEPNQNYSITALKTFKYTASLGENVTTTEIKFDTKNITKTTDKLKPMKVNINFDSNKQLYTLQIQKTTFSDSGYLEVQTIIKNQQFITKFWKRNETEYKLMEQNKILLLINGTQRYANGSYIIVSDKYLIVQPGNFDLTLDEDFFPFQFKHDDTKKLKEEFTKLLEQRKTVECSSKFMIKQIYNFQSWEQTASCLIEVMIDTGDRIPIKMSHKVTFIIT